MQLFCKFKQIINSFFKLVFRVLSAKRRIIKHISCSLFIPICITCCVAVMSQCPIEIANAKKGQSMLKSNSSSIDGDNRILSPNIFLTGTDIGGRVWVNSFKSRVNNISEFFRSLKIISPGVAYAGDYKSCQTSYNQLERDGNGEDSVDKFFQFWIPIWMLGAILGALSAR